MKTFIAFLFALLFCFNASAKKSHYYPFTYSCEIKQKDISTYKKGIKKCEQAYDKNKDKAKTAAQILGSNYKAITCYQDVAYRIIDKYYSESAVEQKEAFAEYTKLAHEAYDLMHMNADECGTHECGTMYDVWSKTEVMRSVKSVVEEYISLLEQSVYHCK